MLAWFKSNQADDANTFKDIQINAATDTHNSVGENDRNRDTPLKTQKFESTQKIKIAVAELLKKFVCATV